MHGHAFSDDNTSIPVGLCRTDMGVDDDSGDHTPNRMSMPSAIHAYSQPNIAAKLWVLPGVMHFFSLTLTHFTTGTSLMLIYEQWRTSMLAVGDCWISMLTTWRRSHVCALTTPGTWAANTATDPQRDDSTSSVMGSKMWRCHNRDVVYCKFETHYPLYAI